MNEQKKKELEEMARIWNTEVEKVLGEEKEEWEEGLDRLLQQLTFYLVNHQPKLAEDQLKDFIHNLLSTQKKEIREKIEQMKVEKPYHIVLPAEKQPAHNEDYWNQAIEDVLSLLQD